MCQKTINSYFSRNDESHPCLGCQVQCIAVQDVNHPILGADHQHADLNFSPLRVTSMASYSSISIYIYIQIYSNCLYFAENVLLDFLGRKILRSAVSEQPKSRRSARPC